MVLMRSKQAIYTVGIALAVVLGYEVYKQKTGK